jgi:outer membrane protein assembly factor BamB
MVQISGGYKNLKAIGISVSLSSASSGTLQHIYVTDSGNTNYETSQISPSGTRTNLYSQPVGAWRGVATDSQGNLFTGDGDGSGDITKADPSTGTVLQTITNHSNWINSLFIDDNDNLYSASYDFTVRKFDSTGNQLWSFTGHGNSVYSVATDNNGDVYSGSGDDTVRKTDGTTGTQIWNTGSLASGAQNYTMWLDIR